MLRFETPIIGADVHVPRVIRPQMPVHLPPAPDEALSSWLLRLAGRMSTPPVILVRHGFGIEPKGDIWWWRRPTRRQLCKVGERTAVAVQTLADLTFNRWAIARNDEIDERFAPHRFNRSDVHPRGRRPIAVCTACLAGDHTPYIRKEWMIGWTSMCSRHQRVLCTHCPACGVKLRLPGPESKSIPKIGSCQHCGSNLANHAGEPAHKAPLQLQERLLAAKATGTGDFFGLGSVDWETIVTAIDLVLGVVWIKQADGPRERLFEKVVNELGLGPETRFRVDWACNYGTMLLFAWLSGNWNERLQATWAIMDAPTLDEAVETIAVQHLHQLRYVFDAARGSPVPSRRSAIDWLMSLPETGDDLRQRATEARHQGLHRKLTVLAMLRDGTDLPSAASIAKLRPDTLWAWLETGMEHGLEAIVGKTLRTRDLPQEQEREISAWLSTIRGRTHGYGAWSAAHVQREIIQRFDIALTLASARSLLHSNHPIAPVQQLTHQFAN